MFTRAVRRSKSLLLSMALLVCMSWTGWNAEAQEKEEINLVKNGDFEQGIAGWKTYKEEDGTSLSQSSEEAYSGLHSLKVETPGRGSLEGANISAKVTPMNNYLISVYAKGEGRVMLSVGGVGGYLYGNKTNLTSEWQELKVRRFEKGKNLSLHVVTCSGKRQKVTFYLDNVKAVKEEGKELAMAEVEPIWYEAEEYKGNAWIVRDNSASGGAYAEGRSGYVPALKTPFPQTSKPSYIYLKVWIGDNSKSHVLVKSGAQTVFKKNLPVSQEWTWVKMGPISAKEVGEVFNIRFGGPDKTVKIRLDAMVVTTMDNLTDKELKDLEEENKEGII
ncbi:MAG: carbohydrate binding domain-containing protein [bacterium]